MVIVAAVSGNPEGASAMTVRAIASGEVTLAISDDYLSEFVRVIGYPAVEERIGRPVRAFETALDIGAMGVMYHPQRLDWPTLRDVGDIIGCSTWPTNQGPTTSSLSTGTYKTPLRNWDST